jgi:hypothetical protein
MYIVVANFVDGEAGVLVENHWPAKSQWQTTMYLYILLCISW